MTAEQRELARHALGLPNKTRRSYRNHFVTSPGPEPSDFEDWMAMVAAGFATRRNGSQLTGGEFLFRLTFAGATAALDKRERLDPSTSIRAAP
jgi:hypothetical protein